MARKTAASNAKTAEEYYSTRAHQDEKDSNEVARAGANAALLINGGAATAVLAFVSNWEKAGRVKDIVALVLGGYAIGVVFASMTFLALTISIKAYAVMNEEYDQEISDLNKAIAARWSWYALYFYLLALGFFVIASVVMAIGIHQYG